MPTPDTPLIVIGAAAFAHIVIGMLWYSKYAFGNVWSRLAGLQQRTITMLRMLTGLAIHIVTACISAYLLAIIIEQTGVQDTFHSMITALWVWAGFIAATTLVHSTFQQRPFALWALTALHELLGFLTMGAIIGYFS